ncbi:DEKNAAC105406 [Brettanomyces naardenensis]|uniref:Inositol-pentakisphosphate 2-kinase n=1 Tax=Brettanomyces naardenensis TaxID=13370 RepID=A0A448YTM3_BRENA|nr:DEKNAAC105406 [Brettanomyces naardenensis]
MRPSHYWNFLGKGSANAVYYYSGPTLDLSEKVLRLRLVGTTVSTREIHDWLSGHDFDPIRKYMLETELVLLDRDLLKDLDSRSTAFRLDLTTRDGLLMRNILSYSPTEYRVITLSKYIVFHVHEDGRQTLLEFKPKWLYDSPEGYAACRNCIQARLKGQKFVNCSLQLLEGREGLERWCHKIQDELNGRGEKLEVYEQLVEILTREYALIRGLYRIQNGEDGYDIRSRLRDLQSEDDVDKFLQLSMAVKDVSVFVDLEKGEVVVVDLDKKSATKWRHWRDQEVKIEQAAETERTEAKS